MKGINVSTLQGAIDWSNVSTDFAMIKATQGRGEGAATRLLSRFTDSKFKRNIENCPVPCGVYHYFTGTTLKKTYEEADYFISVLAPYKSRVKLWAALDVESFYLDGLSAEDLTRFVTAALAFGTQDMCPCFTRIPTTLNTVFFHTPLMHTTSGSPTGT